MKKTILISILYYFFCLNLWANDPIVEAHFDLKTIEKIEKSVKRNATLKALLVIVDAKPGDQIAQSVRVDLGIYTRLLNILEARNIIKVERTILKGSKATLANIKQSLQNIRTGSDDVFLFFFSGHGGMEEGNKTFLSCHDDRFLYRSDLLNMVQQQSARLKLVISDACSNAIDGVAPSVNMTSARSGDVSSANDQIYKQLFLEYSGLMDISASTEGEYAWSNDELGGFFTHYFVKESLIRKPSASWEENFNTAKVKTIQMFNRMPKEQLRSLAKDGIRSQTPKARSLPVLGKNGNSNLGNNTNPVGKGLIVIENATGQKIEFVLDNNESQENWSEGNLAYKNISANGKFQTDKNLQVIGFMAGDEEIYYELESGKYIFDFDENALVQLYPNEIPEQKAKKQTYTSTLVDNTWIYEDQEGNQSEINFSRGNYLMTEVDLNTGTESSTNWGFSKTEQEGKKRVLFEMRFKEKESEIVMYYLFKFEQDRQSFQLTFYACTVDGQEIDYRVLEQDEGFETSMVMYRK